MMPVSDEVRDQETLRFCWEVEDDRTRARWRESVFISVIVHLVIVLLLVLEPTIFRSVRHSLGIVETRRVPEQLTYLALPPDEQVVKVKPKTSIASDKDRLAQPGVAPRPQLPPLPAAPPPQEKGKGAEAEKKELARNLPPAPPVPVQGPGAGQAKVPQPGEPAALPLKLEDLNKQPKLPVPLASLSGRTLDDTIRGMARDRTAGGQTGGSYDPSALPDGFSPRSPAAIGPAQILTDTMGVDFDPYLRRVVADIRRNWYAVMPEIARLGKRGRVVVVFEVQRDGGVPKLYLYATSGSDPLDRAALAGISASVPFPPLPAEFRGPMIRLQVTFLYNMFFEK